jgi:hypothetical protein
MTQVTLKSGQTVEVSLPISVEECGCCGHYHLEPLHRGSDYRNDCRYDANRYDYAEMDRIFGENGWEAEEPR